MKIQGTHKNFSDIRGQSDQGKRDGILYKDILRYELQNEVKNINLVLTVMVTMTK